MTEIATRLGQLASLLRDKTPQGRAALLTCVTDLYASGADTCSTHERDAFGALLADLAGRVDAHARAALSARLCRMENAPPLLIKTLLEDEAVVAAPLLAHFPHLDEAMLLDILARRTAAHASAILEREPLPASVAVRLLWSVPPKLAWQALRCAFEADPAAVTPGDVGSDEPLTEQALAFAKTKEARNELSEPLLLRLMRDGEKDAFLACLDLMTDVDPATATMILNEPSGYALAVLCKAAGFARSSFASLAHLADTRGERGTQQTFALLNGFESIDQTEAQRLLGVWKTVFGGAAPDLTDTTHADRKTG